MINPLKIFLVHLVQEYEYQKVFGTVYVGSKWILVFGEEMLSGMLLKQDLYSKQLQPV